MRTGVIPATLTALLLLGLAGCGREATPLPEAGEQQGLTGGQVKLNTAFLIASGSENKSLEPIIQAFARQQGVPIHVAYMGSVEIGQELAKGAGCPYDAVWPAASLWIELFDSARITRSPASILRMPVVFAVKKSIAQTLGWIGAEVRVADILQAAEARKLRFAMTSATQSNSGASAYLGFLSALAGGPEVLTADHLASSEVRALIRKFLGAVHRSAGSSGFLKDLLVERYDRLDAMVNYEAMAIEANQALVAQGREPLYVVYPVDGLTIADSPLALVSKGDPDRERLFAALQRHLLSAEVQRQVQAQGRRTGLVGLGAEAGDPRVFNPDWGIDLKRLIEPVRLPSGPVIRQALELYQIAFRKPSCTLFVLDFSGSMRGRGVEELKEAMRTLLDPAIAARYLLQPGPEDLMVVMPYSDIVVAEWRVAGNDPLILNGLQAKIEAQNTLAGTHTHKALLRALALAKNEAASGRYHTSIILMSDGEATDSLETFFRTVDREQIGRDIPVYTVLFGQAKERDMRALAEGMGGQMFDGRKDLARAFREAKGYN